MPAIQLNAKHRVRQRLNHLALDLNDVLFRHSSPRSGAQPNSHVERMRHNRALYHMLSSLGQQFWLTSGNKNGVLKMRRGAAIARHDGPAILQLDD